MLCLAKDAAYHEESLMSFLELYCHVDAFCHGFLPSWAHPLRAHGQRTRCRPG